MYSVGCYIYSQCWQLGGAGTSEAPPGALWNFAGATMGGAQEMSGSPLVFHDAQGPSVITTEAVPWNLTPFAPVVLARVPCSVGLGASQPQPQLEKVSSAISRGATRWIITVLAFTTVLCSPGHCLSKAQQALGLAFCSGRHLSHSL